MNRYDFFLISPDGHDTDVVIIHAANQDDAMDIFDEEYMGGWALDQVIRHG